MFDDQISNLPSDPPRSPALLPGLRLRSMLPRGTLTPFAILALLALAIIPVMLPHPSRKFSSANSKVVNGTVVKIAGDRRSNRIEIVYRFRTAEGQEHLKIQDVPAHSAYAEVKTGESVPVEYLNEDPAVNRISERNPINNGLFSLAFLPLFFFLLLVTPIMLSRVIRILRDRRLFRRGRLSSGTVVFAEPSAVFIWWGWAGASTAHVFVSYASESGAQFEARALCQNDWLLKHLAPGTSVHIAYLPNRPSRAALLEAYVR